MANEKRLIDANAMREDWLENGENEYVYDTNSVLDSIDAQPTVDSVEVVRCKDCKHAEINDNHPNKPLICFKTRMCGTTRPNWFCADGERKDDE